MVKENVCCFTGHRIISSDKTNDLRERLKSETERLYAECGITVFYAGGATGFDALASEAVIERRKVHSNIRLIVEHYYRGCMQRRNRYMIDHSGVCVCYLTRETGGTAYTVNYAKKIGLRVINLAQK